MKTKNKIKKLEQDLEYCNRNRHVLASMLISRQIERLEDALINKL